MPRWVLSLHEPEGLAVEMVVRTTDPGTDAVQRWGAACDRMERRTGELRALASTALAGISADAASSSAASAPPPHDAPEPDAEVGPGPPPAAEPSSGPSRGGDPAAAEDARGGTQPAAAGAPAPGDDPASHDGPALALVLRPPPVGHIQQAYIQPARLARALEAGRAARAVYDQMDPVLRPTPRIALWSRVYVVLISSAEDPEVGRGLYERSDDLLYLGAPWWPVPAPQVRMGKAGYRAAVTEGNDPDGRLARRTLFHGFPSLQEAAEYVAGFGADLRTFPDFRIGMPLQ